MFSSGFNRIFGADPKLEFRRPGSGLSRLAQGTNITPTDPYWVQFWLLFDSPSDVNTLLDSYTLSLALKQNPTNLITLINVVSNHLFTLLASSEFPGPSGINWNPTGSNVDLSREALNCVRVLARVIPFVFQNQSDTGGSLEEGIFWTREKVEMVAPTVEASQQATEASQFVIDDEDEDEVEESNPEIPEKQFTELPPLAERLLASLVDLLFVAGFTLPEECKNEGAISYIIWEPGIAALDSQAPPTPQILLSARLEILRLLNILLSLPSLLTLPQSYATLPNRWRDALISGRTLDKKVVLSLLCSILNTALAGGRPSTIQASGVISGLAGGLGLGGALDIASGAAEKLGEVVMRREDIKGLLVGSCLQLLAIFFIEHAPAEASGIPMASTNQRRPSTLLSSSNLFSYYLSKLHRASDFDFLISGIFSLLTIPTSAPLLPVVGVPFSSPIISNTNSSKSGFITETLVILWRMLELNGKFLNYLLETDRGGELLVSLLTFCLEFKDDETQLGLVRLSAFLMQTLTAEKGLSNKLSALVELKPSLRAKYNVPGSIADFLIVSIYTLVFTTKARLSSLYPAFILTITNCSTYFKNLSVVSSTRLLQLFLAFSAPSFLLMEEGNPRLVFYLLETFNNVAHYQLNSNPNLVYSLIRSSHRFEDLSNFTLATAVAEVRKQRLEKKSTSITSSGSRPSSTNVSAVNSPTVSSTNLPGTPEVEKGIDSKVEDLTIEDQGDPTIDELSEKAKGKLRETESTTSPLSRLESLPTNELSIENPLRVEELEENSTGLGESENLSAFVGKNGFIPTEGWVSSWRNGLPLDSILILISEIRPEILSLTSSLSTSTSSTTAPPPSIKSYLESVSINSALPQAPTVHSRKFITSPNSFAWIASLIYGSIYVTSLQLLNEVDVQLFGIERAERRGLNLNLGLREVGNTGRELFGFVLKKVGI